MLDDEKYLNILLSRISVCRHYLPRFGQGAKQGMSLAQFTTLYGADVFYSWFGLDDPLVYAAHKAAGGITSVYRQIGIGCEQVFRAMLADAFMLTSEQVRWSYIHTGANTQSRKLSLDARIKDR
jgi:hypothetical protein